MLHGLGRWLQARSRMESALIGLALAVILETLTCVSRFAFGLQSTRDTRWLSTFTFGFRLHHGYVGILLAILALVAGCRNLRSALVVLAVGLVASDLVHHFGVLWMVTGSPEFDLRYHE